MYTYVNQASHYSSLSTCHDSSQFSPNKDREYSLLAHRPHHDRPHGRAGRARPVDDGAHGGHGGLGGALPGAQVGRDCRADEGQRAEDEEPQEEEADEVGEEEGGGEGEADGVDGGEVGEEEHLQWGEMQENH